MYNVDENTTDQEYTDNVLTMVVGDLIKYSGMEFETLQSIVTFLKPPTVVLEYAQPGTAIYADYGDNIAVVVSTS